MTTPNVTKLKLPAVRRAVAATPWAIQPTKLEALLEVIDAHAAHGGFTAEEIRARVGDGAAKRGASRAGKVAVLPLVGVVAHRMDLMSEMSGGTSSQRFGQDFDAAMADPDVTAIVIDCDSPGGAVTGTPELAKKILSARGKGPKIIAVANGLMASAAYWICSAADEVVASPSAEVGSIGCYMVHLDASAYHEKEGLAYSIIKAGEHKAEGNPYEPLSDDARAHLQAMVDEYHDQFVGAVAKHRGASAKDVRANYGQGRTLTAKQALAAGMVDRVATLEDTLAKLGVKGGTARPMRAEDGTPPITEDDTPPIAASDLTGGGVCAPTMSTSTITTSYTLTLTEAVPPSDGADDAEEGLSPDHRPHEGEEDTVSDQNTAAQKGAVDAAIAAERARVSQITQLCAENGVPALAENLIVSGADIGQASTAVLSEIRKNAAAAPRITVGADREAERPFKSAGEQLFAIVEAGRPGGRTDKRLLHVNRIAAGPTGMNESVGSEGGFFIATEHLPGLLEPVYAEDPILSRVFKVPSDKPSVKYNVVDETSRATGSRWGGIQMYRVAEADTATATKPKLRQFELNKKKMMGIAYLTDELQQDASAAESLVTRAFQAELRFALANEIFRGNGGGQMLGFLNSGAVVSQAIEASQTIANSAQSIATNTAKMLSRIPASIAGGAVWLYNQELFPTLAVATVGSGSGAVPVFLPGNTISGRPYDTLWGKPAFASELCEAVGTVGDIVLVVPSEYHMLADGGASLATSVHVRFLYDENALKITHRSDGAPVWKQAVTPFKGSLTRSPFVTLAARS